MRCPECERGVYVEDFNDTDPFTCESCSTEIRLVVDESTYRGATERYLEIVDE